VNKRKRSNPKKTIASPRKNATADQAGKHVDSEEDLELADKIGSSVELDEIEFETWQRSNSDLDLQIPVWIKSEELLLEKLTKTIQFSRTIKSTPDKSSVRERDSFTLEIPASIDDGKRIVVKDRGDKKGEFCGDLILILRLK
jgi:hypothetical protein